MVDRVIVGVDDSPAATAALAWAAGEARLRGAELVACTVLDRHGLSSAGQARPSGEEAAGGVPVVTRRLRGDPAAELIAAAADADLLVVGSRGRGRLTGLVLGSVSRACLAHAPCPVVVVRPGFERAPLRRRVVVGVDGSDHGRRALRVAAEEAALRDATLVVVNAVHWDHTGAELLTPTAEQLAEWGDRLLTADLAATGVPGTPVVEHGRATDVLVRHSTGADLLVLGSRGHGPLAGTLLGSTGEHCTQHAHCPVMITHSGDAQRSDQRTSPTVRGEATC
ncbi:universal stress protein [Saccharothrix mutabilis subsp. mutabilis]|uniref:Universal stress protein n=1 Tax=Saccharothrix mutabilis subsp. mutabilis TaxID=66855 RepID=A0ABP3E701_9PSEU